MIRALSRPFRPTGRLRTATLAVPLALVLAGAPASPLRAEGAADTLYGVFSLDVALEADVDNDLMTATLAVQADEVEPTTLAERINTTMRWALDTLDAYPTIERETRDYGTWPRYDSHEPPRLAGWGASQTLVLESGDVGAMARAIQILQARLQVQGTAMTATLATRREAAATLIDEALAAFRERARRIQTTMGAPGYRIVEANVQSDESRGEVPVYARARTLESGDYAVAAEPALAGGTSRVRVQVSGRIQLD